MDRDKYAVRLAKQREELQHLIRVGAAIYPGGVGVDRGEAHLIALACSPAPEGHDHWTLRLLAGKVVELGLASSINSVAHMEDVLDLYAEP